MRRGVLGGGTPDRRVAIGGQSNGEGYGVIADLTGALAALAAAPFDRVYIWNFATGAYEKLRMGTNNQGYTTTSFQTTNGTTFGPEFGIAVRWTQEVARGVLYIDKECVAGEMIEFFQKNSTASVALDHQVPFYPESINRFNNQRAWLASNKKHPAHAGWLWVQGESDAAIASNTGVSLATHPDGLPNLKVQGTDVIAYLGGLDLAQNAQNFCTIRLPCANGEQIDRTMWFVREDH